MRPQIEPTRRPDQPCPSAGWCKWVADIVGFVATFSALLPCLIAAGSLSVGCLFPTVLRAEIVRTPAPLGEEQSLIIVTIWETMPLNRNVPAYYQDELGETMTQLGMRTMFVSLEEATQTSFAGRIVVLRMSGNGQPARRSLASVPSNALAWTHASSGDITPFGAVDLPALTEFLGLRPIHLAIDREARRFARALGRVAAHELFHMISRSTEHSDRGLMKPALTARELTDVDRPEWLPRHRWQARASFPQAHMDEVIAAVAGADAPQGQ